MRRMKVVLAALFLIAPFAASADPISVTVTGASDPTNDGQWIVTTVSGDFASLQSILESQVFWGDESLATIFANLVRYDLGLQPLFPEFGAYFAFGFSSQFGSPLVCTWDTSSPVCGGVGSGERLYAIVTRAVPEPSTLALLGLGLAGLGLMRRRKEA